jgi:hypothetical protein
MDWLSENSTALISSILSLITGFFSGITYSKKVSIKKLKQKAGSNSNQYMAGGNQTINK